jgi:hypothetical protein
MGLGSDISGNTHSAEGSVDGFAMLSMCALVMSGNVVVLAIDDATFSSDATGTSFFCLGFFTFSSFVPYTMQLLFFLVVMGDTICRK